MGTCVLVSRLEGDRKGPIPPPPSEIKDMVEFLAEARNI